MANNEKIFEYDLLRGWRLFNKRKLRIQRLIAFLCFWSLLILLQTVFLMGSEQVDFSSNDVFLNHLLSGFIVSIIPMIFLICCVKFNNDVGSYH